MSLTAIKYISISRTSDQKILVEHLADFDIKAYSKEVILDLFK